jgi:succinate dehydrogenase / fumarate reductase iron-sulfur subunit
MRSFKDGDALTLEPFRANAFPVVRDLMVNRSAFDRIIAAGGFISVPIGAAPDANSIPVRKENADLAMDAAACIGCGACVAACPNASAMLFTSAKISHLAVLPQGQPERYERVLNMVATMDAEGFGSCTNHGECEASCPKGINLGNIAQMNRDYIKATLQRGRREPTAGGGGPGRLKNAGLERSVRCAAHRAAATGNLCRPVEMPCPAIATSASSAKAPSPS